MISVQGASAIGSLMVATTDGRGMTPEELSVRAVDRIVYVGDQSHPAIRDQAQAFRDTVQKIVLFYLKEAVTQDRATIASRLRQAGYPDLVALLGD